MSALGEEDPGNPSMGDDAARDEAYNADAETGGTVGRETFRRIVLFRRGESGTLRDERFEEEEAGERFIVDDPVASTSAFRLSRAVSIPSTPGLPIVSDSLGRMVPALPSERGVGI